jgi:hypothetical protein
VLLGSIVSAVFYKPDKTNRAYLQELIDSDTIREMPKRLVAQMRSDPKNKNFTDHDWESIDRGLSECISKQSSQYVASGDPYLKARANKETPNILASRFLKACGAID